MDERTTLSELKNAVKGFITAREWDTYHTPKDIAISISIEASELLEIFQWEKEGNIEALKNDVTKQEKLRDELADILIYCMSMANVLDIDLSGAIRSKIDKNSTKYPEDKVRGHYRKYTEL